MILFSLPRLLEMNKGSEIEALIKEKLDAFINLSFLIRTFEI
jgi:hypothetical protein